VASDRREQDRRPSGQEAIRSTPCPCTPPGKADDWSRLDEPLEYLYLVRTCGITTAGTSRAAAAFMGGADFVQWHGNYERGQENLVEPPPRAQGERSGACSHEPPPFLRIGARDARLGPSLARRSPHALAVWRKLFRAGGTRRAAAPAIVWLAPFRQFGSPCRGVDSRRLIFPRCSRLVADMPPRIRGRRHAPTPTSLPRRRRALHRASVLGLLVWGWLAVTRRGRRHAVITLESHFFEEQGRCATPGSTPLSLRRAARRYTGIGLLLILEDRTTDPESVAGRDGSSSFWRFGAGFRRNIRAQPWADPTCPERFLQIGLEVGTSRVIVIAPSRTGVSRHHRVVRPTDLDGFSARRG
jgi:hypothetical protein